MCLSATKCFATTELGSWSGSLVYKHLVPLGRKIIAQAVATIINNQLLLRSPPWNAEIGVVLVKKYF